MFNSKNKTEMLPEKTSNGNGGATLESAGTTLKGDISSKSDLRIDGTVVGNVNSSAKIVIGANGTVEGNINGNQADIVGKVTGNIKTKDLLQLRGECVVNGDIQAGKLQVEPTATFNGQCHTGSGANGKDAVTEARSIVEAKQNGQAQVIAQ
ncbi:MAG TPA: polymer-forming cytoskeletal protein [Chitinophagaceae bacterium]|nr:polymer-forming cytoskeletal protein [Chitinophagaceae bacterium]